MSINFPSNPVAGDVYYYGGSNFVYMQDGSNPGYWATIVPEAPEIGEVDVDEYQNTLYTVFNVDDTESIEIVDFPSYHYSADAIMMLTTPTRRRKVRVSALILGSGIASHAVEAQQGDQMNYVIDFNAAGALTLTNLSGETISIKAAIITK